MRSPLVVEKRVSHAEAWQWDGSAECAELIADWIETNGGYAAVHPYEPLILLGDSIAPVEPGQWVVRDKFNEYWPLPDDVFLATYKTSL